MKKWDVLESELILNERWYKVRRDRVQLPNGNIVPDFFVSLRPDYINILPIFDNGDVLLVRQYRHAVGDFMLELPAGIVNPNEDPKESAGRELLEETGYAPTEVIALGTFHENTSKSANTTYSFLAKGLQKIGEPELEDQEQGMEVVRLSFKEFLAAIKSGEIRTEPALGSTLLGLLELGIISV